LLKILHRDTFLLMKKPCSFMGTQGFNLAPRPGLEPGTYGLTDTI
jgi:hypothetical protein